MTAGKLHLDDANAGALLLGNCCCGSLQRFPVEARPRVHWKFEGVYNYKNRVPGARTEPLFSAREHMIRARGRTDPDLSRARTSVALNLRAVSVCKGVARGPSVLHCCSAVSHNVEISAGDQGAAAHVECRRCGVDKFDIAFGALRF